ncbi:hypothetical protein ACFLXI_07060, partial [Chloroflexota bacterium]
SRAGGYRNDGSWTGKAAYLYGRTDGCSWLVECNPGCARRTAGAQAVLPSCLIRQDASALRRLCEEDCDLGYIVMRRMANVVASRLLTTRLQLLDMFANPGVEDARDV